MDALAVSRLSVPPRRKYGGHGYYLEEVDEIALPTPYTSAPSSPRRAFSKEVEEEPLGEVRAAVPFAWELIPGTPKHDLESGHASEVCVSSDEIEATVHRGTGSSTGSSSRSETTSTKSLSRDSSNVEEFEFCSSRFGAMAEPAPASPAEELFSNGQLVVTRLRLPPRLQAVKHLRNSDSSCSDVSSSDSPFKSYQSPERSPRSPRPGPMTTLSLCGFLNTGMQGQKHRTLSPLRLFHPEILPTRGSTLVSASETTYFSSDSNSSVSRSSSSSGGENTNAGSPQDSPDESSTKSAPGSTIQQLLFTDMAMASARSENLKGSSQAKVLSTPRLVQSKLELLKNDQEHWNGLALARGMPALTPQLSRSNARSRPAPSPSIDTDVNSSRRENMGRAILANRFGKLCSCLGILPESP